MTRTHNELDISFIKDNRIHIMECKTGDQENVQNAYKLFAISKQLPALATQAYLISNSPDFEKIKERTDLQKTATWNADQIRALAEDPDTELPKLLK